MRHCGRGAQAGTAVARCTSALELRAVRAPVRAAPRARARSGSWLLKLSLTLAPAAPPPPLPPPRLYACPSRSPSQTHMQAMTKQCPRTSAWQAGMELMATQGPLRLWRGASTMLAACVPAHAAYFTVYETGKRKLGADAEGHHPVAAGATGVLATLLHDAIMTPMDVCKQRLQLGYYSGLRDCLSTVLRTEGVGALYVSYPTTLVMNMPYAAVMMATNESLKKVLNPSGGHNLPAFLAAGAGAGAAAAALTTPLDVVKTKLQTQALTTADVCGRSVPQSLALECKSAGLRGMPTRRYTGMAQALRAVWAAEGLAGLFRGLQPRLLVHMPSVAISWTTYETMKRALAGDA